MAKISLSLAKSVEENASDYYERAKKIKKKIAGAEEALKQSMIKLEELKLKKFKEAEKTVIKNTERKKEWYEKFRWFLSSEGFLVVGGRDATSNEIIIKKHAEPGDIVFHTDMAGSPFFVVKSEGREIGDKTKHEAADATCTFSRAWKLGLQTSPVFLVNPDQVSKKAKSGEFMSKGSFMIYGKTIYIDNRINLCIGVNEKGQIMAGPLDAVKAHCKKFIELIQGGEKVSSVSKYVQKQLGQGIDEIIRALPSGEFKIKKQ